MELAAEGRLHFEQGEPRGGERQRGGGEGRQDGRGDGRGGRFYRHLPHGGDGGSSGYRDTPTRRGGATASGTSGGEYTGDSARRGRTCGRGATAGLALPGRRNPRANALGRPPIGTRSTRSGTAPRAAGKRVCDAGTAARLAMAPPATTEVLPRAPGNATAAGRGRMSPRARGALLAAAGRRPRALPGAGPLTPTSARSSGTPRTTTASPRRAGSRRRRRKSIGRRAARPIGRGLPPTGTGSYSADTMPGSPTRPLAPHASCGARSFRADTNPPTPVPPPAMCAASISRAWTSAVGARAGWPAGSPRPFPSCGGRAPTASAPDTRTERSTSSSADTRWSGPGSTVCRARHAGACTTRRAGRM